MPLIECNNLCMGYGKNILFKNMNIAIEDSDYINIVGENGSGKSTFIKGLLGIKNPESGSIIYNAEIKNGDIGFMPQQHELIANFPASVEEVVMSGLLNKMRFRPFYNAHDKKIANEYMKQLKIDNIKNKCFAELSGGQKQRVLLARALCAAKKILILDEPVAGLDPQITKEFYELISEINLKKKITIIMVSHDITATLKYATKILHIGTNDYFYGTTDEYINSYIGSNFLKGRYN